MESKQIGENNQERLKKYDNIDNICIKMYPSNQIFAEVYLEIDKFNKMNKLNKMNVIHSIINFSSKVDINNLNFPTDYIHSYIDYVALLKNDRSVDREKVLYYLSYNLQISFCFTIIYDIDLLENRVNLQDILRYSFNEMKPFNMFILYNKQEQLSEYIYELLTFMKSLFKLDFDENKAQEILQANIKSSVNEDIFSMNLFKTNSKNYRHLFFLKSKENIKLDPIIESKFKFIFEEWKSLYDNCYDNSKNNFFKRVLTIKPFFEQNSYEYEFYNKIYKKSEIYTEFNLHIDEIKSDEFIKYIVKKK